MILGTAGLTAALCVDALQKHGLQPESGPIVVTGATGGVGSVAVAILGKLGYRRRRGNRQGRGPRVPERFGGDADPGPRRSGRPQRPAPALPALGRRHRYGRREHLGTLLRSLQHGGCVAACGLAGSNELPVTVYPFILRAVTLAGIDAAWCPRSLRPEAWHRLAGAWKPANLESMAHFTTLSGLGPHIADILAGRIRGRVVVALANEP